LLLGNPEAVRNPFFLLAPEWAIYPLVALATVATVIASQALISGVFSLTHQAIQLGFTPRLEVRHTSAAAHGQVYLPLINWTLLAACVGLVWGFGSSANLAAAYGIAVTATMIITSIMVGVVAAEQWHWSRLKLYALIGTFLVVDLTFLAANVVKIPHGGWFPLVAAALVFYVMTTWRTGRRLLTEKIKRARQPMEAMIASLTRSKVPRTAGTAVYFFPTPGKVPPAFLANLRHNNAVHESVVFVAVQIAETPRVPRARRDEVKHLGSRFYQVVLHYGFMEEPDVPTELGHLIAEVAFDPLHTTYFLGKEHVISNDDVGINGFRERLFDFMHRNARSAADYFRLPVDRVIEIGIPVEI
jgi:KUP system potassium uptake protein